LFILYVSSSIINAALKDSNPLQEGFQTA